MASLYLVYLDPDDGKLDGVPSALRLTQGIYVLSSDQTRSRVYHQVKALTAPVALLVAPLQGIPKFKGMDRGALKRLRAMPDEE